MGFFDWVLGGQPKSMSNAQWEAFKVAYDKVKDGTINWKSLLPPTNLAGAGAKMASLSVNVALDRGELGKYAGWVAALNEELKQGYSLASIKSIWVIRLEGKTLETDTEAVFYTIAALHMATYGYLAK